MVKTLVFVAYAEFWCTTFFGPKAIMITRWIEMIIIKRFHKRDRDNNFTFQREFPPSLDILMYINLVLVWMSKYQTIKLTYMYSMVPNDSAARLLIFKIFSLPTWLIWTYTLIKIQIIFLPTRLLSTIFYFFIYF